MKKTVFAVFSLCLIRATPYAIGKIRANGKVQARSNAERIYIVRIAMTQTAAVSNPIATCIFGFILPPSK
jgi:hypothetical protein